MTVDVNGRIKLVDDQHLALPGKCAVCGNHLGKFVDIGLDLDFYGVVYFCIDNCFREIANSFDYHSPRQWKMMMGAHEQLREDFNKILDENEELKSVLAAFDKFNTRFPPAHERVLVVPLEIDSEPIAISETDSPEQSGSDEQDHESGSPDLQHDDSLDEFLKSI